MNDPVHGAPAKPVEEERDIILCCAEFGDAHCGVHETHPMAAQGCDKRFHTCRDVFRNSIRFLAHPPAKVD